jgi:hypothetical protein
VVSRKLWALAGVLATFAIASAALPATGAGAASPPTITAIAGYSNGSGSGFCNFRVVVRYSGKAIHGDYLTWYLTTGGTTNTDSASFGLGPSPFTAEAGSSPPPSPGTYHFLVEIKKRDGDVISKRKTSTFPLSGSCPAAGELGSYRHRKHA